MLGVMLTIEAKCRGDWGLMEGQMIYLVQILHDAYLSKNIHNEN